MVMTSKMYHNPVLLKESVDGLAIKENGIYVDVTFGGGGHSKEILKRLGDKGRLIAFDQDEDALANALGDESPQDAVKVASGISDSAQRERLQKRLLRDWSDEDPGAASAWAREAGLPDPAGGSDN